MNSKWLHLSDLHVGMSDQDWLWPTLKHALYQDLTPLIFECGLWDVVIFSGDLRSVAPAEEFEKLNSIFGELWEKFKSLGFDRSSWCLPGNHDVFPAPLRFRQNFACFENGGTSQKFHIANSSI